MEPSPFAPPVEGPLKGALKGDEVKGDVESRGVWIESPWSGLRRAEGHAARLGRVPALDGTRPSLSPSRGVVVGGGVVGGGGVVVGGGIAGQYAGVACVAGAILH